MVLRTCLGLLFKVLIGFLEKSVIHGFLEKLFFTYKVSVCKVATVYTFFFQQLDTLGIHIMQQ